MFSSIPESVPSQVSSFYAMVKTSLTNPLISNRSGLNKTTVGKQGDSVTISTFAETMLEKSTVTN